MSDKKTTFLYVFTDLEASKKFKEFADGYSPKVSALHPQSNGVPNPLKVLVKSPDSTLFAYKLKDALDEKAEKLGGVFDPRV